MPFETVIAEPVQARAWGLKNATYLAEDDPETNFTLFRPVSEPNSSVAHREKQGKTTRDSRPHSAE